MSDRPPPDTPDPHSSLAVALSLWTGALAPKIHLAWAPGIQAGSVPHRLGRVTLAAPVAADRALAVPGLHAGVRDQAVEFARFQDWAPGCTIAFGCERSQPFKNGVGERLQLKVC